MNTTTLGKRTDAQLEHDLTTIRKELLWRRMSSVDDPFAMIKGHEHVKRALVVAAVQGHSILLVGPGGCGKSMCAAAGARIGVVVHERRPCPCGNFNDSRLVCSCSPARIEQYWRRADNRAILESADIQMSITSPMINELESRCLGTTLAQVQDQLNRTAKTRAIYDPDAPGCKEIIRQAGTELGLTAGTIASRKQIACSIARLAERNTVDVTDLLEALHYRIIKTW